MIFVTIGTQLPFDRLIRAVDLLAGSMAEPVFAQIGGGGYRPVNMEWTANLAPAEFEERFRSASRVVSHAGIGTLLTARRLRKPLILMPRRKRYGEHRNDHQLATVAHVRNRPGVHVAETEEELAAALRATEETLDIPVEPVATRDSLIYFLRQQIAL